MIKECSLLISESPNNRGGKDYVIAKGKKIGDVFKQLPFGIIDKTQTGIGGTSCQLDSDLDSIIVQPYF